MPSKHILFATIGSLGDLHPCIALALQLKQRGYRVTIATTPFYRLKVEELGIGFRPLRPDWNPSDGSLIAQCENIRRGPEILIRLILSHLKETYTDLLAACSDADLMLAGELVYAAPLVAEKMSLNWASLTLSPCTFFSAHDPSVLVTAPELIHLRRAGTTVNRMILNLSRVTTHFWWKPVRELRRREGLQPGRNPLLNDKFSPHLVLALFSSALAEKQPDWPAQTIQPGFVYFDRPQKAHCSLDPLRAFLDSGEPPIIFTQGSTAVHHPGDFYKISLEAARSLGRRALLLGARSDTVPTAEDVLAVSYAPYSEVFPLGSVIVHQGGTGTTAVAMQAGKPMLFVPFGWDQPDNAARLVRRGAALTLSRRDYTIERAVHALQRLNEEPSFQENAMQIRNRMQAESGLTSACSAIEKLLSR